MSEIMKSLQKIVIGIGILGVVIVLISIILSQMKSVAVCATSYTYNVTGDNCYLTANSSITSAVNGNGAIINNTITAVGTPVTYFTLIVLVVVFVFLLGFLIKKLSNAGKGGSGPTRD